mgnify:CR=1 FL=1
MFSRRRETAARERVAVIGLGRFGSSVARVSHEIGYEVTAIDIDERRVAEAASYATLAAQADGSDEATLRSLGVDRSEVAVVGQGQNIEASISCALVLKRIGVPWVIAKAESEIHGAILLKVGADRVVSPEQEAGAQVAHSLEIRHEIAYKNLTATSGVARLTAPAGLIGQTVAAIEASTPDLSILLIQRGAVLLPRPVLDTPLQAGDVVVIAGDDDAIDAFADR